MMATKQENHIKAAKELGRKITQIKSVKVMAENVSVKLTNGETRLIPTSVWSGEVTEAAYAQTKLEQNKAFSAKTQKNIKNWVTRYAAK